MRAAVVEAILNVKKRDVNDLKRTSSSQADNLDEDVDVEVKK